MNILNKEEFTEIEKKYLLGQVNEMDYLTAKGMYEQYANYEENKEAQKDNINPTHYKGSVQPIDLIDAQNLNFAKGSIIKYVCRSGRKDNALEDLKKALYYLNLEIQKLEK